jgi:TolA-binding protein
MRGTVFAVLITALPTEAQTNVVVQAGEASVLSGGREYRLTAGQAWASSANVQDEVEKVPMAGADAGAASSSRSERTPPLGPKVTSSDLGQQNRMFESARAARRGGQSNLALQRFAELMTTFPRSEQAHNARVEHFRLLRSLGRREEASRSARAYLSKYPRGFAAAEARELTR